VVVRKLFELGRFGQKTGAGYYRYDGRTPLPDPEVTRICEALAEEHGVVRRGDIPEQEIVERLMYPLINEGTKILEEGIAYRPGDIDVVWVAGYGFPDHRGGPLFMADQIGLKAIAERLAHHAGVRGDSFGYWAASDLSTKLARSGEHLSEWTPS
jgi:3-hydroxyacyl-CoA dehydrogenase